MPFGNTGGCSPSRRTERNGVYTFAYRQAHQAADATDSANNCHDNVIRMTYTRKPIAGNEFDWFIGKVLHEGMLSDVCFLLNSRD